MGVPRIPENVELQRVQLETSNDLSKWSDESTNLLQIFDRFSEDCYIFGYGSEAFTGDATLELRMGAIQLISQEECENDLGKYMAPERGSGMFCAIGRNPCVDACQVCCFGV